MYYVFVGQSVVKMSIRTSWFWFQDCLPDFLYLVYFYWKREIEISCYNFGFVHLIFAFLSVVASQDLRLFFPCSVHTCTYWWVVSWLVGIRLHISPDVLHASLSLVLFLCILAFSVTLDSRVNGTLPGFPPFFMKPEKSHRVISYDNAKTSPIYFLPRRDHCLPSPGTLCLATHCIIYLVCFMVVLGRRINPIPYIHLVQKWRSGTFIHLWVSIFSILSINLCKYLKPLYQS